MAGITSTILALVLFMYRYYFDHVWSWDLAAVALTNVAVKISLMVWFRLND